MKTITILIMLLPFTLFSQVGIGTTSPTASLDINGDVEIVNTPTCNVSITNANDNIVLVKDLNSNQVQTSSIKELIKNNFKTLIKGNKTSDEQIALISAGGTAQIIDFNNIDIDSNNEYSTTTNKFIPKQNGWYEIYSQITIEPTNPISATISNDFRLNITKNGTQIGSDTGILATLTAIGTNVFIQPTRKVKTIVYLTTSDYIQFEIENRNTLVPVAIDVTVLGDANQTYFYVKQIR